MGSPANARDISAVTALGNKPPAAVAALSSWSFGTWGALKDLYHCISPEMPSDLTSTMLPSALPNDPTATAAFFNHDEGHAGRFTVPNTQGASLDPAHVFSEPAPLDYVTGNLVFYPVHTEPTTPPEVVLFSPGLNTLHQPAPGETSTPQRLQHYVNVLGSVPMAQVHTGTSMDQGDAVIDASTAPLLRGLLWLLGPLLPGGIKPTFGENDTLIWHGRELDSMQTALSQFNLVETPLKDTFRQLLETTKNDAGSAPASPLVLFVYSRAVVEVQAALHKHIETSVQAGESKASIEKRLRDYLTVVTAGSACNDFPDGPAYVHVAAWNDPLSSSLGVTSKRPRGAGKDAVFINFDTPFNTEAVDNHNLGAVSVQYLALVMSKSSATGLRDLWTKGRNGGLVFPGSDGRLLNAMIRLTKGTDWLWDSVSAWQDVDPNIIPNEQEAEDIVSQDMGTEYVSRLKKTFG